MILLSGVIPIKKKIYSAIVYSSFISLCLLPVLIFILVVEYHSFQSSIAQLHSMIAAYRARTHLLDSALENSFICANCATKEALNDNDDESCIEENSNQTQPFVQLNRDSAYLKNSTSHFFKAQQLDNLLSHIDREYNNISHSGKILNYKKGLPSRKKIRAPRFDRQRYAPRAGSGILQWPIQSDKFWLSSFYGPRRKHDGSIGFHYGIDMAAVKGTPVMAAAHGVVTQAHHSGRFGKHAGGFGNFVVIRHTNQLTTRYAHLDSVRVKNGQKVHAGTVIGTVGETGHIRKKTKDGSHLHFELFQYNRRVNPLTLLPPIP